MLRPRRSDAPDDGGDEDLIDRLIQQAAWTSPRIRLRRSEGPDRSPWRRRTRSGALSKRWPEPLHAHAGRALPIREQRPIPASSTRSRLTAPTSCAPARGFEYRGQCRHARDIKATVAAGKGVPDGYRRSGERSRMVGFSRPFPTVRLSSPEDVAKGFTVVPYTSANVVADEAEGGTRWLEVAPACSYARTMSIRPPLSRLSGVGAA